jgi:hypothetical protein
MLFLVAGVFGLGGPEIAALLVLMTVVAVPACVVVLIVKAVKKPNRISRFCPKCGRGLTQEAGAPFCCYCGNRLP